MTRIDTATGEHTDFEASGVARTSVATVNVSGGLDYNATARDRLSASGSLQGHEGFRTNVAADTHRASGGIVLRDFDTTSVEPYDYRVLQGSATWRRAFAQSGRILTLSARHTKIVEDRRLLTEYQSRMPLALRLEERETSATQKGDSLSAAYTHPLHDGASLRTGYDFSRDEAFIAFRGFVVQPGGDRIPMADVSNKFAHAQTNHQAYVTWQKPFSALTVLAGRQARTCADRL